MVFYNWSKHLKDNFESFKNSVINEMIDYYGEEYKKDINERLDRVNFVFYGNTKLGIPSYNQSKYEKMRIILPTKGLKYTPPARKDLKDLVKAISISHTTIYDPNDNSVNFFILFPLYSSDKHLIHEMVHAITNTPLCLSESGKYYAKTGLEISDDNAELLLEESITEIDANIIYTRLKDKGTKSFVRELNSSIHQHSCYYCNFIPQVIDFYINHFKEVNHARITLDKRSMFKTINKEEYDQLLESINNYEKELIIKYEGKNNCKVRKL